MKLILGPRPGKKSVANLQDRGVTHLVTLLSDREDAATSGRIANKIGAKWIHIPMDGGHLEKLAEFDLANAFQSLSEGGALDSTAITYLHCSAGIHRTGFLARVKLAGIRPVTAEQVGEDRLLLADDLIRQIGL